MSRMEVEFRSRVLICVVAGLDATMPACAPSDPSGDDDGSLETTSETGLTGTTGTQGGDPDGGMSETGGGDGTGGSAGTSSGTSGSGPDSGPDSDSSSEPPDGDGLFLDVTFEPHPDVATIIEVHWRQDVAPETSWIRFSDGDGGWFESPRREGTTGTHREVLLGVPEATDVSFELVAEVDGQMVTSRTFMTTTGAAPDRMPRPALERYDEGLTSPHPWLLVEISESTGFEGPHWVQIVDREGRIVWYFKPAGGENGSLVESFFPRVSRDGTHLTIDQQKRFDAGYELLLTTLDFEYRETITLSPAIENYDITDDGHILYTNGPTLVERSPTGTTRDLWTCDFCAAVPNTVNWDPATDTVALAFPTENTVTVIDRASGTVVASFGDHGSWAIEPDVQLGFPHWPVLTEAGTMLLSTQADGSHRFVEFELDPGQQVVRQMWIYQEPPGTGPRGMIVPIPGTTHRLANHGQNGVVAEVVTADKRVVWSVDYGTRILGNSFLVDDLYDLNRGP